MCVLFLYINPDPKEGDYKVVLVNNRDEYYSRPTIPAHKWESRIYGGMDAKLKEGGTWLGVSEAGKIACLLNIFQPEDKFCMTAPSRGCILIDYLQGKEIGPDYIESIRKSRVVYNPFNLVTLDPEEQSYNVSYYNSEVNVYQKLDSGVHGFGNSVINRPFRKVQIGQRKLTEIVAEYGKVECEEQLINELFTMMQDTDKYFPDKYLMEQCQGHKEDLVRSLSSIFVTCPSRGLGTRTTTAILVDHSDRVIYRERTMQEPIILETVRWEINSFSFFINKMD